MIKPAWVTNEPLWLLQCADVVGIASKVLNKSDTLTEHARALSSLGYRLRASQGQAFTVFRNLASETESFPIGAARSSWSLRALPSIDAERRRIEDRFTTHVMNAATQLIAAYDIAAT